MKLVRHVMWFTLRSLRPVLALWAGVLVLQAIVLWVGPAAPVEGGGRGASLDILAMVLRFTVTVVLVSVLVQRHLLVGTTAFWRTRPMPRTTVLASTLASAVPPVVVVPFLWFTAVLMWMGLDAATSLQTALVVAGEQAAYAGLALALASVSRNLAQVVVMGVSAMSLFALGGSLIMVGPRRPAPFAIVLYHGEWIEFAMVIAVGLIATFVSVHQHLTLKTVRSIGLMAALVMSLLLFLRFPLFWVTAEPPAELANHTLSMPKPSLDRESIRIEPFSRVENGGTRAGRSYSATVWNTAAGAIVLKPINAAAVITFPDGVSERFAPRFTNAWLDGNAQPTVADQLQLSLTAVLEGAMLLPAPETTGGRYRITFLEVREDTYAARSMQPARLDVTLDLVAYRLALVARASLGAGRLEQSPAYAVTVEGTAAIEDGVAVMIRETYIRDRYSIAPTRYVLRNQRLKQAVVAIKRLERPFHLSLFENVSVLVSRSRLEIALGSSSGQRVTVDPTWLADAEVLVLKPETLGRVSRSIRIDDFMLAPPPQPTQAPAKDQVTR